MVSTEHLFWTEVALIRQQMQEHALEGQRAVVRVTLRDQTSLLPRLADARDEWIIFQTIAAGPETKVIAVRPNDVARVEIAFEPADKAPTGFNVGPVKSS